VIWHSTFRELGRPLIVAHGGASSAAPANTIAAFHAAKAHADAIETDVWLTGDDVAVCIHDEFVSLEDGSAVPVGRLSLRDLQHSRPATLTLADACALTSAIFLDIKERDTDRFVKAVQIPAIVASQERFIAGVPTTDASLALAAACPGIHQVALMPKPEAIDHFAATRRGNWVRLHEPNARLQRIAELRNLGARLMITCGCGDRPVGDCDPRSLEDVFSLRPDAIVVNNPALASRATAESGGAA
jgi:hypothetical protein